MVVHATFVECFHPFLASMIFQSDQSAFFPHPQALLSQRVSFIDRAFYPDLRSVSFGRHVLHRLGRRSFKRLEDVARESWAGW